ncbi:E1^E4 [Canis familiaris papillomavirus 19]|uniref:E1^E4 n=1 Tax=Canis familiaris papillomavirus 19 TaxID=2759773 RepID=A0A1C9J6Z1_9PAPI|nr:E1^E4 [Canis familiaris papillomavirus 19]
MAEEARDNRLPTGHRTGPGKEGAKPKILPFPQLPLATDNPRPPTPPAAPDPQPGPTTDPEENPDPTTRGGRKQQEEEEEDEDEGGRRGGRNSGPYRSLFGDRGRKRGRGRRRLTGRVFRLEEGEEEDKENLRIPLTDLPVPLTPPDSPDFPPLDPSPGPEGEGASGPPETEAPQGSLLHSLTKKLEEDVEDMRDNLNDLLDLLKRKIGLHQF